MNGFLGEDVVKHVHRKTRKKIQLTVLQTNYYLIYNKEQSFVVISATSTKLVLSTSASYSLGTNNY